jgi:hypothetical protein
MSFAVPNWNGELEIYKDIARAMPENPSATEINFNAGNDL